MTMALGTVALLFAWRRQHEASRNDPQALSDNIQDRLEELESRIQDAVAH